MKPQPSTSHTHRIPFVLLAPPQEEKEQNIWIPRPFFPPGYSAQGLLSHPHPRSQCCHGGSRWRDGADGLPQVLPDMVGTSMNHRRRSAQLQRSLNLLFSSDAPSAHHTDPPTPRVPCTPMFIQVQTPLMHPNLKCPTPTALSHPHIHYSSLTSYPHYSRTPNAHTAQTIHTLRALSRYSIPAYPQIHSNSLLAKDTPSQIPTHTRPGSEHPYSSSLSRISPPDCRLQESKNHSYCVCSLSPGHSSTTDSVNTGEEADTLCAPAHRTLPTHRDPLT